MADDVSTQASPEPLVAPAFSETMQSASSCATWTPSCGAGSTAASVPGPREIVPDCAGDIIVEGKPWRATSLVVIAGGSGVQWELTGLVGEGGPYARFFAERGLGLHHVALGGGDLDATMTPEAGRGTAALWTGSSSPTSIRRRP